MTQEASLPQLPGLVDIYSARKRIQGSVVRTPIVRSALARRAGGPHTVYLKLECFQPTGAFKLRGATNAALALPTETRARGFVTVSSGNHGRAVAYLAQSMGLRAVVCLSDLVTNSKIAPIESLGAELSLGGRDQDEAMERARQLSCNEGLTYIDPFDDFNVISGQGTIGIEILEDVPDLDAVIVPTSGGGLLAGVGMAVKSVQPKARVIGVSMSSGAAMHAAIEAGHPVKIIETETYADALQGGLGENNQFTFRLSQNYVDQIILLSEEEIARSMKSAFVYDQLVLEGAGAVGYGAISRLWESLEGASVAIICSGRNVPTDRFLSIIDGHDEF